MKYKNLLIASLLLSFTLSSCDKKAEEEQTNEDPNIVEITAEQFKVNEMQLGSVTKQMFDDQVSCRGVLQAPNNGVAQVSAPIAGSIKSVNFKLGDFVRAGQVLCSVAGTEFMSLQQQFAEAAAAFQKAKADYERMKALRAENIGAKKDYVSAESIYKASLASYNALRARVSALHVNPSQIENGQMYNSFPVVSPISGYITHSTAVVGQYVDMMNELAEVVDTSALQLQLSVFEVDVPKLQVGQPVIFTLTGDLENKMNATLTTIGKAINPDTKSIDCIARLNTNDISHLVSQSYVEAKIITNQKEGNALPTTAILKSGEEYFVFLLDKNEGDVYTLRRMRVDIGKSNEQYTEILTAIPDGSQILTCGVDTL